MSPEAESGKRGNWRKAAKRFKLPVVRSINPRESMDGRVACQHCRAIHRKAGKRTHPASSHHKKTLVSSVSFHCSGIRRQMLAGSTVAILSQYMRVSPHAVPSREGEGEERRGRQRLGRCVHKPREPRPVGSPREAGRQRRKQGLALEPLEGAGC